MGRAVPLCVVHTVLHTFLFYNNEFPSAHTRLFLKAAEEDSTNPGNRSGDILLKQPNQTRVEVYSFTRFSREPLFYINSAWIASAHVGLACAIHQLAFRSMHANVMFSNCSWNLCDFEYRWFESDAAWIMKGLCHFALHACQNGASMRVCFRFFFELLSLQIQRRNLATIITVAINHRLTPNFWPAQRANWRCVEGVLFKRKHYVNQGFMELLSSDI